MPLFSVLLPTHNRSDVLPFAIQAVLDQTEEDFELLVVGDGCTDDTAAVMQRFDDPRLRWFDLPKAPYFGYANRNVALREAKGDLIAIASHDDLLFPDHLALMAGAFADPTIEFAYSLPLWAMSDGTVLPVTRDLGFPDELDHFLTAANFMPAQCVVHRRSCLDRYGYFPEDVEVAGDWTLWRRFIEGGGRANFRYLPIPTGLHFQASWRTRSTVLVDTLAGYVAKEAWWPEVLRPSPAGDRPEQADFAERLQAGSGEWVVALRQAVTAVLGRLATEQLVWLMKQQTTIRRLNTKVACMEGVLRQRAALLRDIADEAPTATDALKARIATLEMTPPDEFDEALYLARNPAVAAAVAEGRYASGFKHWCLNRTRETRDLGGLHGKRHERPDNFLLRSGFPDAKAADAPKPDGE